MSLKEDLQTLNNKIDKVTRKFNKAKDRADYEAAAAAQEELDKLKEQQEKLKAQKARQSSAKAEQIKEMAFHRVLTKKEQADMGKLKKAVKGLVTVHPLTALGKELGVSEMTGYADKAF
ncbi:YibL family ribosome-associated protein [Agaribacterium sp. ZY112]|uniref:YibL family ribosome-associated protein n=1 Tax=Agaribacterium sp. ZY112 TaxID=3233574 RepID=UPI0035241F05